MPLRCPQCSTVVSGNAPTACPTCGFAGPAPAAPVANQQTLAIVGLILNVLVLAGLGSIIGGRTQEGIWQLVLYLGGIFLVFIGMLLTIVLIGFLILPIAGVAVLAGWIWGLVTGIQMVQDASQA